MFKRDEEVGRPAARACTSYIYILHSLTSIFCPILIDLQKWPKITILRWEKTISKSSEGWFLGRFYIISDVFEVFSTIPRPYDSLEQFQAIMICIDIKTMWLCNAPVRKMTKNYDFEMRKNNIKINLGMVSGAILHHFGCIWSIFNDPYAIWQPGTLSSHHGLHRYQGNVTM